VLTVGTVLAAVRDDLQVGAGPGGLEAEEHGAPARAPRVAAIRHKKVHAMCSDVAPHFQHQARSGGEKLNEIRAPKT
jgi:hypothetical protein